MENAINTLKSQQFCKMNYEHFFFFGYKYEMVDHSIEEFMSKEKGCTDDLAELINITSNISCWYSDRIF